jgi:2-oxoglutarate dehydrogenase E2 component (dihydrolipoamide succinyltransferase)
LRKLAAEHDLDLAAIAGTGTGGRITKHDVEVRHRRRSPGRGDRLPAPRLSAAAPVGTLRAGRPPVTPLRPRRPARRSCR